MADTESVSKKPTWKRWSVAVVAVSVTACGGAAADDTTTTTEPDTTTTTVAPTTVAPTTLAESGSVTTVSAFQEVPEVPNENTLALEEPIDLQFGDVTVTCDEVTIQSIESLGDFHGRDNLKETTKSVVILTEVTVTNDSAEMIQFYPWGETIVLDGTQYDARSNYGPDEFFFGEILGDATKSAHLLYELPVEVEEVLAAGELRLVIDMTYAIGIPDDDLDIDLSW